MLVTQKKSRMFVENSFDRHVVVKASERIKLIRVYVERHAKDLDHQFDIPEDDDIIDQLNEYQRDKSSIPEHILGYKEEWRN